MRRRRAALVGAAVLIGLGAAVVAWFGVSREPIRIGRIAPLTGTAAHWGKWTGEGIDLAVEEINARGGVRGRDLVIQSEDSKGDVPTAVAAMRKLVERDKIRFVLGPETSAEVLAVAPIAQQNKIPLITATAASPEISVAGDFIFRIYPTSAHEASYLVSVARRLKLRETVVLFIDNAYGAGVDREVVKRLGASRATIRLNERYDASAADVRPLLDMVKSLRPDAIFLLGYPDDMARILRQAKEIDLRATFLAPATFDAPVILPKAGDAAEGVIFVYPEFPDSDASRAFREKFRRRYGAEANIYSALGYDAVSILAAGIRHGGRKAESVRDALRLSTNFPGASGAITFGGSDVNDRPMALQMIRDGKVVPFGALAATAESSTAAGPGTSPGAILRAPNRFDGVQVLLTGKVANLKVVAPRTGDPSYTFDLVGGDGTIHVRSDGTPSCEVGRHALVEGRFERVHRIDSYLVHNLVTATTVTCE